MRWVKLASAIDVEAAAAGASTTNNLRNCSPSMNMAAAELEERCSSTLNNNGGRTQEIVSVASEILALGNGGYGGGSSNYCPQEQWELGGVVFANARFY
ncbi:hypothetical protein PR202_gb11245 [Eleusine coracana subsp. coracana]|uniref:Uncharacterized protein n=1 Tax=Eleusine coracana subsp. coracana TaxID=191504 RepID=A0AAV5ELA5_ELECO|nr:hypothetical protein PR202_gb11245 [Eleusine coracana subsp. coracana]